MKNEDSIACMEAFLRKADLSSVKDLKEVAFLSLSIPDLATAAEAVGRIADIAVVVALRLICPVFTAVGTHGFLL